MRFFPLPTALIISPAVVKAKVVFCEGQCFWQHPVCLSASTVVPTLVPSLMLAFSVYCDTLTEMHVMNGLSEASTGKSWLSASPFDAKRAPVPDVVRLSQLALQRKLGGPVAPVCGPFFFMDFLWLLCLELRPIPARNLHRMVLGQFVFVVGPLEETTLEEDRREIFH